MKGWWTVWIMSLSLGVVLGKDIKAVSKEDALDAVFGYTVINDVSARNLQTRHKQWYMGMTLQAGTIIATGTPAGVGMRPPCFLKKGDVVVCEIEKIGRIENRVE